ncbi:MAG: hypothetical protein WD078_08790 [Woeseia sp.]
MSPVTERAPCYLCGELFEAAPQARYCSTSCRKKMERIRSRRRDLHAEERMLRAGGSRWQWRLARLRLRIVEMEKFPP